LKGSLVSDSSPSEFIKRLLAGPDDVELSPRDMALLEAYLRQPVSFATIQQEKQATGHSLTKAARDKLKLIRDFNRGLQGRGNADEARPSGAAKPPTLPPPEDKERRAALALLRVYVNNIADERFQQAARIAADDKLTVNEKLTRIDELIPFPPTASAEQLGAALGVTKQAVMKTEWWDKNRRGMADETVELRRDRLKDRGRRYERPRFNEDTAEGR
jgi:hypothetical protein